MEKFRNITFDWDIEKKKVSAKMIFPHVSLRQFEGEGVSSSGFVQDAYRLFLNGTHIRHVTSSRENFTILTLTLSFAEDREDHNMTVYHFNKLVECIYDKIDINIDRVINPK